MSRPARTGALKRRIIAEWEICPTASTMEIARRAGASSCYTSVLLSALHRPKGYSRRRRHKAIVDAWLRSDANTYSALARLTGYSRFTVARAMRSIEVDLAPRRGFRRAYKAKRILKELRIRPTVSTAEIARLAGATRSWAAIVLKRPEAFQ